MRPTPYNVDGIFYIRATVAHAMMYIYITIYIRNTVVSYTLRMIPRNLGGTIGIRNHRIQ